MNPNGHISCSVELYMVNTEHENSMFFDQLSISFGQPIETNQLS